MNAIDKKRMAEGVLYNFSFSPTAKAEHVDALVDIKDRIRAAGLAIVANKYGQIEIVDRETRVERARTFAI